MSSFLFTLAASLGVVAFAAPLSSSGATPAYQVDAAFQAPAFTAKGYGSKVFVMPDDSAFVFSHAPGFHRLNGAPYGSLLRFKPDGGHDTAFVLDKALLEYAVTAVAPAPESKLFIAVRPMNSFLPQNQKVLRLHGNGSLDPAFDSGSGTTVDGGDIRALTSDADGKLLVGGSFYDFSGSGRAYLARLHPDGSVDTGFQRLRISRFSPVSTSAGPGIIADTGMKVQSDGKILIAGAFSEIDSQSRLGVARLNADGTLDSSFNPRGYTPAFTPGTSGRRPIYSVAVQPDGKVLLAGVFNPVSISPTQFVVRLNVDGSPDSTFNAERIGVSSTTARSMKLLSDGRIVVAVERALIRYETTGAGDTAFRANLPTLGGGFSLHAVDAQSDGRTFCAGTFVSANGAQRPGVARLNPDGTLDLSFNPGDVQREFLPAQLAVRSDGRIVAGGRFDAVDGAARQGITLLNRNGTVDPQSMATPLAGDASPGFFLQPDDKLLLFGLTRAERYFSYLRLDRDGAVDPGFSADASILEFDAVLMQPDGDLLLSGGDSAQAVANGEVLARINADGSRDASFNPDIPEENWVQRDSGTGYIVSLFSGDNRALLTLPDGRILFKFYDGGNYFRLVWLDANGARDPSPHGGIAEPIGLEMTYPIVYDPQTRTTLQPAEGAVHPSSLGPTTALRLPDGKIILGGEFISYDEVPTGGIVRVNPDASFDSALGSGAGFLTREVTWLDQPSVTDIALERDGKMLVVGNFESFHGVPAPGIVRLNQDGSVDTTFEPPVSARTRGTALSQASVLVREGNGRFLLAGNYAATAGSNASTSIFRLEIPVRAATLTKTSANTLQIQFTGVPGASYKIQTSSSLTSGAFSDATAPLQASPDGTFIYEDTSAFVSLQRFYRAVSLD